MTPLLVVRETRLTFTEGKSNKFYHLKLIDDPNLPQYLVERRWGRIGSNGDASSETFSTKEEAEEEYAQLLRSKKAKGYVVQQDDFADRLKGAKAKSAELPTGATFDKTGEDTTKKYNDLVEKRKEEAEW